MGAASRNFDLFFKETISGTYLNIPLIQKKELCQVFLSMIKIEENKFIARIFIPFLAKIRVTHVLPLLLRILFFDLTS